LPEATPVAAVVETAEQRRRRQEREERKRSESQRAQTLATMKEAANPLRQAFGVVAGKFMAVAGPLSALQQILDSTTSGFQTLGVAVKVAAGAVAPVLLPATLLLAAGVTAAASVFTDVGMPAMEALFEFVIDTALPSIEILVQGMEVMASAVNDSVAALKEFGGVLTFASGLFSGRGGRSARSRVDGALTDVLASFRRSLGPRAQISGLAEVGKQAQLAALNSDPLEARLMRHQIQVLERIEAAIKRRREADRNPRAYDELNLGAMLRDRILRELGDLL
jgi:hypothetical protein